MSYQAETYLLDSEVPLADLGHWKTYDGARGACTGHAGQPLIWIRRSFTLWEALGQDHWYQVVITED